MRRHRLWLCLPPVLLALLDGALTLAGQPAQYWSGDFAARRELNPFFDFLLAWHPGAFLAGLAVWCLGIGIVILFAPWRVSFLAALLFTLGHACGAGSWIVEAGAAGWVLAIALLVASERTFWWAARLSSSSG
jgi:hypothetical protein